MFFPIQIICLKTKLLGLIEIWFEVQEEQKTKDKLIY